MSEMTYTKCSACNGTTKIPVSMGIMAGSQNCPCTRSSTPGWSPTGVTTGQIDRWGEWERCLVGDPGIPRERRDQVLKKLHAAIHRTWSNDLISDLAYRPGD